MSRQILFLCHRVPYPPDKGDRIRSWHLLERLAQIGDVHLAFLSDEPVPETARERLSQVCRQVFWCDSGGVSRWGRAAGSLLTGRSASEGLFASRDLHRQLDRWFREVDFDDIVCFSSPMLPYVTGRASATKIVMDMVDVDSRKWENYAERSLAPLSWLFRWEARQVARLERRAACCRHVVLVSHPEAELYRAQCPEADVSVVTNGVDLGYFAPQPDSTAPECVFVGYLNYRANVIGLQRFCREVWPLVRQRFPAAHFRIVGRNPVAAVTRLGEVPGVEVVGGVPDVRPCVAAAGAVVVPLDVARGVQNKILEAMAMARCVIASPAALSGLPVQRGRDVLVAESPESWVSALEQVWTDPARRQAIGRSARRYVERHHDWEACLAPFERLLTREAEAAFHLSASPSRNSLFTDQPA